MSERHIQAAKLRLQGLTYEDIGRKLAISRSAARSYVHQGKKQLRVEIAPSTRKPAGIQRVEFVENGARVVVNWKTAKERAALAARLIEAGYTKKAAAYMLGISFSTVVNILREFDHEVVRLWLGAAKKTSAVKVWRETRNKIEAFANKNNLYMKVAIDRLIEAGLAVLQKNDEQASQKS